MPEIMGSYLYELKPYIDKRKWKEASGNIDAALKSSPATYNEWAKKKSEIVEQVKEISKMKRELEELDKLASKATGAELRRISSLRGYEYKDGMRVRYGAGGIWQEMSKKEEGVSNKQIELSALGGSMGAMGRLTGISQKVASGLTRFAGGLTAAIGVVKKVYATAMELADKAAQMSNKLNAYGKFADMGTRTTMSRYGISAVQANAMQNALSQLGLSESDFGRMTKAQRDAYDELVNYYQEGMDRIDPAKLEEFYGTMDEFQMSLAKWKMDLQVTILKLFTQSDSFKRLMGSVQQFFATTIEFLSSPVVQWFFDTFIELLNSILTFVNSVFGFSSGSSSTTTNNTSTANNNYYIYGSDYASNDDLARSIALKQSNSMIG